VTYTQDGRVYTITTEVPTIAPEEWSYQDTYETPEDQGWFLTAPSTIPVTYTASNGRTYTVTETIPASQKSIPVTNTYTSHGRTYTTTEEEPITRASFPVTHTYTSHGRTYSYTVEEPVTEIIASSPTLVDDGYWGSWGENQTGFWNHHSQQEESGEWVSYYTPTSTTEADTWKTIYTPYDSTNWVANTDEWKPVTGVQHWS